mmetsp:Transcript_15724/g.35794  ORF Transcript_15724/g.35794 Transcript_15724/m.35794 type:complete len:705 (+) Transcript_15724:56-2170(+)
MRVSAVFAASAAASSKFSSAFLQTLDRDMNQSGLSPMKRIIKLLVDMQEQLQKDAVEDKAMYEKLNCWCNSNNGQKQDAVEAGEKHIEDLNSDIESGSASVKELKSKLQSAQEELEANEAALEKATSMRTKEKAEFQTYEKEAIMNVEALKAAVMVLEKSNTGPEKTRTEEKKDAFKFNNQGHAGHGANFLAVPPVTPGLSTEELHALLRAVAQSEDAETTAKVTAFFQQQPEYNNQSGEIFGIMNNLLEQMTGDLQAAQEKESEAASNFHDLRTSKEAEIQAGEDTISETTDELAATNKKLVDDKEDLENTTSDVDADKNFLASLAKTCASVDKEYAERSQLRSDELSAVSDTIDILTSEDAQTLTSLTQKSASKSPSFVQTRSESRARSSAADLLQKAARRAHSAPLSALAVSAKRDAFTKVKAAMEEMLAKMKQEQIDEVHQKAFCQDEFQKNDMETQDKENEKTDLETKIDDLTSSITRLEEEIKTLQEEIHESFVQLKKAGEDRMEENADYKKTLAEADGTVVILKKAEDRLKQFYGLLQQPVSSVDGTYNDSRANPDAKAPGEFKKYSKNENSGGALGLISKFIKETQEMKQEAIQGEQDAQAEYEDFLNNTNESVASKNKSIVDKTELKATAEADKVQAEEDHAAVEADLESLGQYKGQLHQTCDWVLKHFDEDQAARNEEMEAIRQAEGVLAGALA